MPDAPAPGIVRAFAMVADVTVPYRRVGRGAPVVLLAATLPTTALYDAPRELSVIVPEEPPIGPAFDVWLALFLDTLGVRSVSIVASGDFVGLARGFAGREPDRVLRVLWIADGESSFAIGDALHRIVHSP